MSDEIRNDAENHDLEIGEVVQSLLDCVNNENDHTNQFSPSIHTAPRTLRDLSPTSFNPRLVSIGPLHREHENVQAFEKQKPNFLVSLMGRINSTIDNHMLRSCVEKVYSSMPQIRASYVWTKTYDNIEVAKMMVMDACFILEYTCGYYNNDDSESKKRLRSRTIIYDLVLLENQIPFFVLDQIYQCTIIKNYPGYSLAKFIHPLLNNLSFGRNLFKEDMIQNISIDSTPHILHLLHQYYAPPNGTKSNPNISTIHSAIDLHRAGVNFKPKRNPRWVMGMNVKLDRFPFSSCCWTSPTLRMPLLYVHDFTELVLRNLIAYEQSSGARHYITSYAYAMDMLVNTQEDVATLVQSRVLVNYIGSNEEVANMINNICKQVQLIDFFYHDQWEILNRYCEGYWPKNMARMRRTYFSNPWNLIALLAGVILFFLTVVQTIFTIKSARDYR